MAKRMLIDANHPEETRVAVLSGNRLEDYDHESASRKPLTGNIYLAKVTRVEPSLQAAFVDYGGNRHGFLPFSEIHPDYYRIPIADREALIAEEASLKGAVVEEDAASVEDDDAEPPEPENGPSAEGAAPEAEDDEDSVPEEPDAAAPGGGDAEVEVKAQPVAVDTVGGDEIEDAARRRAKLLRRYKIQEVIKRRQVILVQVTKEERGNKGAALTTYLSLAGRYCVLMPNTGRGGGISRKIGSAKDRRRLKSVLEELDIPDGVSVIVRTAGSQRTKAEIRRDYEYLLRLWNDIREKTLASTAPALIHEEASLITRSIRDLYQNDMEEVLVEGDEGYKSAKRFMKSLIPSHARKVKQYKDAEVPLFYRFQVEGQIDGMHNPTVQLKSGGYVVINMTEALVAIDVNSGKATRERNIEETAYRTNLEAADEVARQVRLRDLAGLVVIDFIDMEDSRHNRNVERRLKDAMRHDRARIQLGRISPFGLLEMSRQRLRPSLFESSTVVCPHCNASGYVRTTESVALHVLRGLEEEGIRRGGGEVEVRVRSQVALYILNEMRGRLVEIEQRYGIRVGVRADDTLLEADYGLERISQTGKGAVRPAKDRDEDAEPAERRRGRGRRRRRKEEEEPEEAAAEEPEDEDEAEAEEEQAATEEQPRRRRRRGKRGGRRRRRDRDDEAAETGSEVAAGEGTAEATEEAAAQRPEADAAGDGDGTSEPERKPRRPRRGRRKKAADEPAAQSETQEAAATASRDSEQAAAAGAETPSDESAKPKRRRRSRGAAKSARTHPDKGNGAATGNGDAAPSENRQDNGEPAASAPADATEEGPRTEAKDCAEPERAPEPAAAETRESEPAGQPRRRGWWQRLAKM